ncbi:hypothetical protein [Mangrovihabitans endophyticus]|uniref:Uncharacterized protein n=1 Tax=Mangrovihabitans endophyticus TaxID=1751298 RepID=A0A8J3C3J6_9ACTN|nr:hypothetical protein [Mangrovihabitans endophyticus]GGL12551.1 hypothetical protein GCM10012284_54010 [Mangrovihabitans endophyticus]
MTAHDTNQPDGPPSRTSTPADAPVPYTGRDRATVIIWRTAADSPGDTDAGTDAGTGDASTSPLTPRLAHHLVAIYSDVHSTVLDFDADIHLQHAAEATGRTYTTATDTTGPKPLAHPSPAAALILLRWPRPDTTDVNAGNLLSRCQQHLADDGSTIVVVTATQPGADTTSYHHHEQVLLAAVQTAGLRHLHDIVPIDAADGRDAFTYATGKRTARHASSDDTRHGTATTLMIFGHPRRRP